jgi:hypothetical protein
VVEEFRSDGVAAETVLRGCRRHASRCGCPRGRRARRDTAVALPARAPQGELESGPHHRPRLGRLAALIPAARMRTTPGEPRDLVVQTRGRAARSRPRAPNTRAAEPKGVDAHRHPRRDPPGRRNRAWQGGRAHGL